MSPQLEAAPEVVAPAWQSANKPEPSPEPDVAHLLAIPMRAEVILGTLRMKVGAISALKVGTVLRTLRTAGEPLELTINSAPIAAAEVCPQGRNWVCESWSFTRTSKDAVFIIMEDLYQQFIGIVIVLGALIAMLWYARKRGFARLNIGTVGSNRMLKVVERVSLTPQHTLFVVAVGDRTMVLSSSPGSCQVITELNAETTR